VEQRTSPRGAPQTEKKQVNDWMLVDWDDIVIHLFSESARSYYELEKLWFSSPVLYRTPQ
jgi:ribosome-associated protein